MWCMKKENRFINILKGFACILIVLNHYHGTDVAGNIIYAISHFGVPVFFLISGYYLYSANGETLKKLPQKVKHICYLILLHIGLYVLDFICQRIFLQNNLIRKDIVINDLLTYFTVGSIKSSALWSTSLFGAGQWFLIALLEAYLILWIAYRAKLGNFIEKNSFCFASILLLFHIPVRIVLIKCNVHQLLGVDTSESLFVRNVWFDAIPFMLLGLGIRTQGIKIKKYSVLPILSFIALMISVVEMFLTKDFLGDTQISSVLYFGTIIAVVSAFLWAILNTKETLNSFQKLFEYIGKHLSMIVYFIHVIVGTWLQYLCGGKFGGRVSQYVFPMLVIVITVTISWLLYKVNQVLSRNPKYSVPYLLVIAICFSLLVLPSGSEYRMLLETTESGVASIQEIFNKDNQSTILVTAQNSDGITIDASEIPVTQFIGGGINRTIDVEGEECTYHVIYINDNSVMIDKTDEIKQMRVWAK